MAGIVRTPQLINVTPVSGVKTGKSPSKSFKLDLLRIEPDDFEILERKGVKLELQIFANATLETKSGRAGNVGMKIVLDGRQVLKEMVGQFDPLAFPPGEGITFNGIVNPPGVLKGLKEKHVISVVPDPRTKKTDRQTFWKIHVLILDVTPG